MAIRYSEPAAVGVRYEAFMNMAPGSILETIKWALATALLHGSCGKAGQVGWNRGKRQLSSLCLYIRHGARAFLRCTDWIVGCFIMKMKAKELKIMNFQQMILTLQQFWAEQNCIIVQPYDTEKGAGTMNPMTYLRSIGPEPWNVAYVEPSRRPADGRYGENPNRLYQHHQFQVILKPSPDNIQELYLESLKRLGIDPLDHDIRFVEDNWEAPTLGAWGLGWEVWLDGMEITQFTYFQQVGGIDANPVAVEITYGMERLASYIQDKENVFDLEWVDGITYGDVFHQPEFEHSKYTFEVSDVKMLFTLFNMYEEEANKAMNQHLVFPAYDYVLKCSHTFNLLDARGAISVTERTGYIMRVRNLARQVAATYLEEREKLGFPLIKKGGAEHA